MFISHRIRESRGNQPEVVVLKDSIYAVRLWVAIPYSLSTPTGPVSTIAVRIRTFSLSSLTLWLLLVVTPDSVHCHIVIHGSMYSGTNLERSDHLPVNKKGMARKRPSDGDIFFALLFVALFPKICTVRSPCLQLRLSVPL